jgi:hypothetical protein
MRTEAGRVANHSTATFVQAREMTADEKAKLAAEIEAIKVKIGYRPHGRPRR